MALSVLNHKWWPDVVLKQDKPDFLKLDLFGLREISLSSRATRSSSLM
jgi:hypothetical protein